jgi:hypothetical protein
MRNFMSRENASDLIIEHYKSGISRTHNFPQAKGKTRKQTQAATPEH